MAKLLLTLEVEVSDMTEEERQTLKDDMQEDELPYLKDFIEQGYLGCTLSMYIRDFISSPGGTDSILEGSDEYVKFTDCIVIDHKWLDVPEIPENPHPWKNKDAPPIQK